MIFDTHAHYDDKAFDEDREELLSSMPLKGVGLILDPGCDVISSKTALALAWVRIRAARSKRSAGLPRMKNAARSGKSGWITIGM